MVLLVVTIAEVVSVDDDMMTCMAMVVVVIEMAATVQQRGPQWQLHRWSDHCSLPSEIPFLKATIAMAIRLVAART